jgi:hypothetical protein
MLIIKHLPFCLSLSLSLSSDSRNFFCCELQKPRPVDFLRKVSFFCEFHKKNFVLRRTLLDLMLMPRFRPLFHLLKRIKQVLMADMFLLFPTYFCLAWLNMGQWKFVVHVYYLFTSDFTCIAAHHSLFFSTLYDFLNFFFS